MTTPVPAGHRRSTTLLALVLPVLLIIAGGAVAWSWRDSLPDPIAVHWGADGPDGFGDPSTFILGLLGIALLCSTAFWLFGLLRGQAAASRRSANGLSVWIAVLLIVILLGSLDPQRGLTDATTLTASAGPTIGLAFLLATVLGVLAGVLTPADAPLPTRAPVPADAVRLTLDTDERAVWIQRATGGVGLVVGCVVAVGFAVLAVFVTQTWLIVVSILTVLLILAMFDWVVRVDASGLHVRSRLGFPRAYIPLDELVEARAITVSAFREYGGWGWRTGRSGQVAVVLRSGEAIEVTSTAGRVFVVTVDDAATGAALLNGLADRARKAVDTP